MSTVVTVLFGSPGAAVGWVSEEQVPHIPAIGTTVRITFHIAGDDTSIDGQVYRAWDEDGGEPSGLLIYGGKSIPDAETRNLIEIAGWEPLSEDTLDLLAGTIHESPTMAALHEVNLFVGSGDDLRLYRRVIEPTSPILPLFGQRMRVSFLVFDSEEAWGFESDLDEDEDDVTDAEWRHMQEQERDEIDLNIFGHKEFESHKDGIPVIVFYSSLVDSSTARLGFWTPTLGSEVSEFDLVADDWEVVDIPGRFDPEEFDMERRLDLAIATHVVFESNNYDSIRVSEWWMENPEDVTSEDEPYLPPYLFQWSLGVQELDNIDSYLERWAANG